jgi:hypothetical protein
LTREGVPAVEKVLTTMSAHIAGLAVTATAPTRKADPEAFIEIQPTGGCNRFLGHYTYDGSSIKIGPLGSTRMACASEVMGSPFTGVGLPGP